MSYDKTQLKLLDDRLVADGLQRWTLDTADSLPVATAPNYISNAFKQSGVTGSGAGIGMAVGDEVTIRRWSDLTAKTAANFLGVSTHYVSAVVAAGATLTNSIKPVIEDALALTLTPGQSGSTIVLDKLDGVTITLPVPQIGLEYNFVIDTASTSVGQKIITDALTTFLKGTLVSAVLATPALAADAANGTTHVSINMNGTTTGGAPGSWFKLICRSATIWEIAAGFMVKSGSVATTFATS